MKIGDIIKSSDYYGIIIDKTSEARSVYKVHWIGYSSTEECVSQFSVITGERDVKIGDLVRMESAWVDSLCYCGVIIEEDIWKEDIKVYRVYWFDDNRRTWEDGDDIEVINEKALQT